MAVSNVVIGLVLRIPILAVAVVGLIIALTRMSQNRSPAMLAAGGCGLIVVAEIVELPVTFLPVLIRSLHLLLSQVYILTDVLGVFYVVLLGAGIGLLIGGVFAGRVGAPAQRPTGPQYPYQQPRPGQYQQAQPGPYQQPQPPPGQYQPPPQPPGPYDR